MTPTLPRRADARVGSFVWTPATGGFRSCPSLPTLLDLAADDGRPLLDQILDHLDREDVDRLHHAVRDVRSGGAPRSVEIDLTTETGSVRHLRATATLGPEPECDSVVGVVHDVTAMHHVERALEVRHAVTAALVGWDVLGFDALLGSLGTALGAEGAAVWAAREAGLSRLATWRPGEGDTDEPGTEAGEVVVRASQVGLPVVGPAGLRTELAFPIVTLSGVMAVVSLRSASGLPVSETLERVLVSVGRELGAFFATRPCRPDDLGLSPREREVLELVAEGLSAPEIADRLVLSPGTVRSHVRNVFLKLEVGDRVSAVVKAMRAGLLR